MAATIESTANAMSVISITNTVGQNAACARDLTTRSSTPVGAGVRDSISCSSSSRVSGSPGRLVDEDRVAAGVELDLLLLGVVATRRRSA